MQSLAGVVEEVVLASRRKGTYAGCSKSSLRESCFLLRKVGRPFFKSGYGVWSKSQKAVKGSRGSRLGDDIWEEEEEEKKKSRLR